MEKDDILEIDLREIVYILLKKWYLIVLCFVLSAGTAFVVTQFYIKPVYKAETTLFLGKEKDQVSLSFSDIQVNNQLVVDYREILQSRRVAEIINQKFGVGIQEFQKNVNVKTVKDSRLFSISYEDTDPKRAADCFTYHLVENFFRYFVSHGGLYKAWCNSIHSHTLFCELFSQVLVSPITPALLAA